MWYSGLNPSIVMPTCPIRVLVLDPGTVLPKRLPVDVSGRAAECGLTARTRNTLVGDQHGIPGFWL